MFLLLAITSVAAQSAAEPGCYFLLPSGCPNQRFSPAVRWIRDEYGERNRNAKNDEDACLITRKAEYDQWCGVTDTEMFFAEAGAEFPALPSPTLSPTELPTPSPTELPTPSPSELPTPTPTEAPIETPVSKAPTQTPVTEAPTQNTATASPDVIATSFPTQAPTPITGFPIGFSPVTRQPTQLPTQNPGTGLEEMEPPMEPETRDLRLSFDEYKRMWIAVLAIGLVFLSIVTVAIVKCLCCESGDKENDVMDAALLAKEEKRTSEPAPRMTPNKWGSITVEFKTPGDKVQRTEYEEEEYSKLSYLQASKKSPRIVGGERRHAGV